MGLVPNPSRIRHNDIQNLYKSMSEFFKGKLNPAVQFYGFTETPATVVAVFITINMNAGRSRSGVEDYCAVYLNSWGEMFCMPSQSGKIFANLAVAKKDILFSMGIQTFPASTRVYFPRGKVA